jgi:hypothetical protein
MHGGIHSLPQYTFMAWCSVKKSTGTTLPLPFTIKVWDEKCIQNVCLVQHEGEKPLGIDGKIIL